MVLIVHVKKKLNLKKEQQISEDICSLVTYVNSGDTIHGQNSWNNSFSRLV